MIRSKLASHVAVRHPYLTTAKAERVVTAILDRIAEALAAGDRVELRDFGTFSRKQREARTGRNPRTGEAVAVEAKSGVHFRPGRTLDARLNHLQLATGRRLHHTTRAL